MYELLTNNFVMLAAAYFKQAIMSTSQQKCSISFKGRHLIDGHSIH
jgi:hypothetical protein